MEGAGPRQRRRGLRGAQAENAIDHLSGTTFHLGGGAARKGEQEDALRIGSLENQVGDPIGQGIGFAGAGASDQQQRAMVNAILVDSVRNRFALPLVERGEQVRFVLQAGEHFGRYRITLEYV